MDYYKHWKYRQHNEHCAVVWCPTIHEGLAKGYTIRKEVVLELKSLDQNLRIMGFKIAVIYTELVNPHIMRLLTKVGFDPHAIDLNTDRLWFKKEL